MLLAETAKDDKDEIAQFDLIDSCKKTGGGGNALRSLVKISLMVTLLTACSGVTKAGINENKTVASEPSRIVEVATAEEIPTEIIPTPTDVVLPTLTAEPTAIPTEIATEEPKVKDYGICEIENFRECVIPEEDLFNGEYLKFLRSISKPFDPTTFKDPLPPLVRFGFFGIEYSQDTAPNFPNGGTPFNKDRTFGIVIREDGRNYAIMPIEYPDREDPTNKDKNVWVILEQNLFTVDNATTKGRNLTEGEIQRYIIKDWEDMNIVVIETNMYNETNGVREADPLAKRTFEKYPDMSLRFDKFVAGDTTALDGLIVKTFIAGNYTPFK
jgi:hypothetical protein